MALTVLRQSCSVSTNVTSALEVFLKRYALYKFTFFLLYFTYLHRKVIDTGAKLYSCTKCEKSFTRERNLSSHMDVHGSAVGCDL